MVKSLTSGIIRSQRLKDSQIANARRLRKKCTPAEKVLWNRLRNRKLAGLKFRRQQLIQGFIADFYCEKAKLVIEVDGLVHQTPRQMNRDKYRETVFKGRGIYTLRIPNEKVFGCIEECLQTIILTAKERMA
ncbi:endonuclease domain-containing protein [Chitinispirillales bacterium ANBcel5]|uniref:endonuclease domain-containing protein n=1 Tax=Cellulosispirillum alkaliphilum TaxID=3039283 RepID=UPI002A589ECC|nr:endonuclease domain-containing protein [Chitinispirillales bacterium ANBcel5]